MSYLKLVLLGALSFALFSCDQKSSVSNGGGANGTLFDKTNGCFKDQDIMAGNIVGGTRVNVGDSDQKMAVFLIGTGKATIEFCTANAIGRRVLLTAAHCIDTAVRSYAVALYPSVTCSSGFKVTQNMVSVSAVVRHQNYNDAVEDVSQRTADIGLVFLKEDLPEDYPIFKIADPAQIGSSQMYLYGYGRTGETQSGVGTLRRALLPSSAIAVQTASKLIQLNQQQGTGMCQGDSGGAGFVKIGDEMQILGINSYVERVGNSDLCGGLGYETTAFAYKDWIEAAIAEHDKVDSQSR